MVCKFFEVQICSSNMSRFVKAQQRSFSKTWRLEWGCALKSSFRGSFAPRSKRSDMKVLNSSSVGSKTPRWPSKTCTKVSRGEPLSSARNSSSMSCRSCRSIRCCFRQTLYPKWLSRTNALKKISGRASKAPRWPWEKPKFALTSLWRRSLANLGQFLRKESSKNSLSCSQLQILRTWMPH